MPMPRPCLLIDYIGNCQLYSEEYVTLNQKPVSIAALFSKVIEMTIAKQRTVPLERRKLPAIFSRGLGIASQQKLSLSKFLSTMYRAITTAVKYQLLAGLDLPVAFSAADHEILLRQKVGC